MNLPQILKSELRIKKLRWMKSKLKFSKLRSKPKELKDKLDSPKLRKEEEQGLRSLQSKKPNLKLIFIQKMPRKKARMKVNC